MLLSKHVSFMPSSIETLILCLSCLLLLPKKNIVSLVAVIAIGVLLGFWRTEPWQQSIDLVNSLQGNQVVVTGRVVTDIVYDERGQTEIEIDNIKIEGIDRLIKGKMRVGGFGIPIVLRHDEIQVIGKIRSGFGTRIATMSFAEIKVTGRSQSPTELIRRKFSAALYSSLPEEKASLALGILVGTRTSINEQTQSSLRRVGLTHIIAVSGYNLSVLVRLVRRRLKRLSKFQSTALSVLLVVVFMLVAGGSASVIRAAWVVGLSLSAWYYGRSIRPVVLLLVSAAATAWFDPFYVWYDIGWWLSFAAFYGVLLLGPQLQARLYRKRKASFFEQIAVESFAASLLTMPLIMWIFQRVSIVSIFSNLLVVPLVPIVMVLSVVVGILYFLMFKSLLFYALSLVTSLSLGAILLVSDSLSKVWFAEISIELSTVQMVTTYLLIVALTFVVHQKTSVSQSYNLLE